MRVQIIFWGGGGGERGGQTRFTVGDEQMANFF